MNQLVVNQAGVVVINLESVEVYPWSFGLTLRRQSVGLRIVIALEVQGREVWRQEFGSEEVLEQSALWQSLRDKLVSCGSLQIVDSGSAQSSDREAPQAKQGDSVQSRSFLGKALRWPSLRWLAFKAGRTMLWFMLVVLVLFVVVSLIMPKGGTAAHPLKPIPDSVVGSRASERDYLSVDDRRLLAKSMATAGVIVGRAEPTGKRMVVLFEDPMCSNCRDITRNLTKMRAGFGYTVLPIGMMTDESKRLAAIALCAQEPAKAWEGVMRGDVQTGQPCEKGLKQVEANNQLFLDLNFSETPMLIAPDGRLAKGSAEAEDIERWLEVVGLAEGASHE